MKFSRRSIYIGVVILVLVGVTIAVVLWMRKRNNDPKSLAASPKDKFDLSPPSPMPIDVKLTDVDGAVSLSVRKVLLQSPDQVTIELINRPDNGDKYYVKAQTNPTLNQVRNKDDWELRFTTEPNIEQHFDGIIGKFKLMNRMLRVDLYSGISSVRYDVRLF